MKICRGNIIYADLGNHDNSTVQSGIRPCIVVSNNTNNRYSKVINVCPMTTKVNKRKNPVHIVINPEDVQGYLEKVSILLAEQIVCLDKKKIVSKVGCVSSKSKIMTAIDEAIRLQLGMKEVER